MKKQNIRDTGTEGDGGLQRGHFQNPPVADPMGYPSLITGRAAIAPPPTILADRPRLPRRGDPGPL